ncbi:hypothetical protein PENTCL1PPCAC_28411, partial [Pristionchus entomophagus]
ALAIVHDGASGATQEELTNLLVNGCTPSDVTNYYSSLTKSLLSTAETGVAFKTANRFYIDDSISLKHDYQKHVEDEYHVSVKNLNMKNTVAATHEINDFVDGATNGKIKDMIKELRGGVQYTIQATLVNAIHFLGKWKYPFEQPRTYRGTFKGYDGDSQVDFMPQTFYSFRADLNNDIGTVLILPYKNEDYTFFFVMPNESSNHEKMRNELTGTKLVNMLRNAKDQRLRIRVPKFKIDSHMNDAVETLSELGVKTLFGSKANLSKISAQPFGVSQILHNAIIEVDEEGTEAAAATDMLMCGSSQYVPPEVKIDRPFLFGILRNDDILIIG